MAGITVEFDGTKLTTIELDKLEVVDVSVHGALDQNPKARLSAFGGNYSHGGGGHLIWISESSVPEGKVLTVRFTDSCGISDKGRTIQELFPDDISCKQIDFTINSEMAAELRSRPRLYEKFTVSAESSHGAHSTVASDDRNTDFTFNILWDWTRQNQARLRFATYCLDDVLARREGTVHIKATISFDESASFTLVS